jgi:hypothetical protein
MPPKSKGQTMTLDELVERPVAWRWRYRREGATWRHTGSERVPYEGNEFDVGVEVEPLYPASRLLAMQEALEEARPYVERALQMRSFLDRDGPPDIVNSEVGTLAKIDALLSPNRSGGGDA